ncbi:spondin domain-containing protein [Poriferisphaera sp. WC338]|uniref:spondin domain-containing protein n=1 Tax=Poriferisphaera sp. WC338 TaxID=3425129 RepID=UPI003D8195A9
MSTFFTHIRSRAALFTTAAAAVLSTGFVVQQVQASGIQVTIENIAQDDGFFLTPLWVGFHDGSFDVYDTGTTATRGLERLAEDGNTAVLSSEFDAIVTRGAGGIDDVIANGGPIAPGTSASKTFNNLDAATNRYFSYVSMVIPSNDAFIASGNPVDHAIFDASGNFAGPFEILIFGSNILDAGTEANDEFGVAFLTGLGGQTGPDQGTATPNSVVSAHTGLDLTGNIIGGTTAAGTTISADAASLIGSNQLLARITVSQLPEPTSLILLGASGLVALGRRRKQQV